MTGPADEQPPQEAQPEVVAIGAPAGAEEAVGLEPFRPGTRGIMIERTAQWLAMAVAVIFGVTILLLTMFSFVAFWMSYFYPPAQACERAAPIFDALNLAETLLPYLATPLGVALGYYFTKRGEAG